MKLKLFFPVVLLGAALHTLPQNAIAQKDPKVKDFKSNKDGGSGKPGGAPGKPGKAPNKNKDAPFDLGLGLLIGAGAAYGLKKALDNKRRGITPR